MMAAQEAWGSGLDIGGGIVAPQFLAAGPPQRKAASLVFDERPR
jgi:hypothetical protein